MARIRTIKPEFFTSETLAALPVAARLTFVGLWTYADDEGRGRDNAALIRAAVWPLGGGAGVERYMVALAEAGLLVRYATGGKRLFQITNWTEHQRISHPTPSKLESPPETIGSPPDTFSPRARAEQGKERNREQGTGMVAPEESPEPTALSVAKPKSEAQLLTEGYVAKVPLSNFVAVLGIVRKALRAPYPPADVEAALSRLAADGRGVTTETLRVELDGLPAGRSHHRTDERVRAIAERIADGR